MLKKSASLILLLYLTLGCFRGYLALFDKGASEPKQIFPCPVSSLPDADREEIAQQRAQYVSYYGSEEHPRPLGGRA